MELGKALDVTVGYFHATEIASVRDVGQQQDRQRYHERVQTKNSDSLANQTRRNRADEKGRQSPKIIIDPGPHYLPLADHRYHCCRDDRIHKVIRQSYHADCQGKKRKLITSIEQGVEWSEKLN